LTVDDFPGNGFHDTNWVIRSQVCALYRASLQERLGHVHSILVMGNHLVNKEGSQRVLIRGNSGSHARHHVTVHRVNASAELSQGGTIGGCVAHKLFVALLVGQLKWVEAVGTALLVKGARLVVHVRQDGLVCLLDWNAAF
jgi:hypothetical protein